MYTQDELDNHANQLNPNNDAYWESRGYDERPDDWEDLINGDYLWIFRSVHEVRPYESNQFTTSPLPGRFLCL